MPAYSAQDQLLVERYAVHKITKVDHAIPHNTVIAEVTNQVTAEESTRTLRWDEHVTTEEPLEVKIGEIGKITVELVQLADEEDRPVYRYKITDGAAGIDQEERIYIWVRDCAPTTRSRRRRSLASCEMPAKRIPQAISSMQTSSRSS